ncbi:hypothetical protein [Pseudomonas sp. URMO17WK12:I12]|uniref:hypothetical protein n=1 Tax=Pseudomonas sp. URMO17WK12:I12 TaxID=1259797 RepID=UPI000487E173|nr:hypothetical protein [Pseudomonas sp. URMO17WK12:I12]
MELEINTMMVCVHTTDNSKENSDSIPTPDIRSNKPIGFHDQEDNSTAFFQKLVTANFYGKEISIAIPNEISLSLSISKKAMIAANKKREELNKHAAERKTLFESDVKIAYDFLEEVQKSVVFAYKAVESFCNASIPDSYTYKKTTSKGVVEYYGKEQIERWISTSEKVSLILPEILVCSSPTEQKFWGDFKNLERIRNELIHSKSSNSADILTELFSEVVTRYIASGVELLEFFIKLDPCNPIFPLGFGTSQIKVISVPNAEEYLQKI